MKSGIRFAAVLIGLLAIQTGLMAQAKTCTVQGKVSGLEKSHKITVVRKSGEFGSQPVKVSKTKETGEFSFVIPVSAAKEILEMRVEDVRFAFNFFAEPGTVTINADKDKLYAAELKGTPENERWNAYQKVYHAITMKRNALMRDKNISRDERGNLLKVLDAEQKRFEDSLIKNVPQSIVALHLAKGPLPMMKHQQIDSVLAHFKPYFASHKYYIEMKKRADVLRRVAPGATAPDFNVQQPDGVSKISLSSLRGKYVMLDFWASWCVPCRAENVHTKELYEKYRSRGLEIVSFSLDSDREAWRKAIEKDGITWKNASDLVGGKLSPVAQRYGIDGLPAVWVIDPKGKIIAEGVRGEALDKLLESVLIN